MCGIAGIVGAKGHPREAMGRMLAALRHRGPDGEGVEVDEGAILGHRRLSIIDLDGGRQPLTNPDRTLWLVCNGEIYNYRELRADLEARGQRFLTNSDCEVIIGLYEVYGDRLVEHLRGMFSFGLWDTRRRRLLAARDHLGQKPFYYTRGGQGFAFSSEVKGLLAWDPALRTIDLQALDQYLALRVIAPPLSMFRGIHKLPPGHTLVLEAGGEPIVQAYWDLGYQPKLTGNEESLVDELEERITEALRLHLVSDVPVGAFLSGGMDSSLLVAMLTKRLGVDRLPTFTGGIDYAKFDEAPAARAIAQLCGTEHRESLLSTSLLDLLPDLIYHLDEPSDPLSLCAYQIAAFASKTVKVVIGGDGGDELFGGYDRYYGNTYAGYLGHIPASIRQHIIGPALALIPATNWYKSLGHQTQWLHQLSFLKGGARYAASLTYFYFDQAARQGLLTADTRRALGGVAAEDVIRIPYESVAGDALDRMLYADSKVRLPDHPVMITDRMSMAHGLETRSPFMDHRLAEFAARIPSRLKVRGRNLRYIQRKLAARYLPPAILDRPKQGFSSALPYLLQAQYRKLYERYLSDSTLVRDGILAAAPIQQLVTAHLSKQADHGNRLWLLINAELWYRMMILGMSREALREELKG